MLSSKNWKMAKLGKELSAASAKREIPFHSKPRRFQSKVYPQSEFTGTGTGSLYSHDILLAGLIWWFTSSNLRCCYAIQSLSPKSTTSFLPFPPPDPDPDPVPEFLPQVRRRRGSREISLVTPLRWEWPVEPLRVRSNNAQFREVA